MFTALLVFHFSGRIQSGGDVEPMEQVILCRDILACPLERHQLYLCVGMCACVLIEGQVVTYKNTQGERN